jgi:hypothetical protein
MGILPSSTSSPLWRVADLLARVVALREALADGRLDEAEAIGERVELDLLALKGLLEGQATA